MANRSSPSSNPIRAQNPSPRTPEPSTGVRKIPGVNPNSSKHSVSNSPTDIPQRNSSSKGGVGSSPLRASFEQKENERDLNGSKLTRARSPATPSSKGAKNFMSPTISASSKVISASPKRKVLSERNDGVRSSLTSVSDSFEFAGSEEIDPKSEMGFGPQMVSDNPKILKCSSGLVGMQEIGLKPVACFGSQEALGRLEMRKCDSEPKNHRSAVVSRYSPPAIAPLDANPALPPYDPKTNYLSPRPQFLHFKPKPRIELYLDKEEGLFYPGDGKQLENSFSSESSEDTIEQTEETQSSDPEGVCENDSFSSEVETGEVKGEIHGSKSKLDNTHVREGPKFRSFPRSKFMSLVLVLVVASLSVSVTDTPIISSSSMLKDQPFSKLYTPAFQGPYLRDSLVGSTEFANFYLDKIANKFRDWSINSIAHFQTMFSVLREEEFDLFHLINLTDPEVDRSKDLKGDETGQDKEHIIETEMEDVKVEESVDILLENIEMEVSGHGKGGGTSVEQEIVKSIEEEEEVMEDGNEEGSRVEHHPHEIEEEVEKDVKGEESCLHNLMEKIEMEDSEHGKEEGTSAEQEIVKSIEEEDLEDRNEEGSRHIEHQPHEIEEVVGEELKTHINLDSLAQHTNEEGSHLEHQPREIDVVGIDTSNLECDEDCGVSYSPKTSDYASHGPENKHPLRAVLGISSLVLTLVAILITLCVKQKCVPAAAAAYRPLPPEKVISSSVFGSSESYMHAQNPLYQNYPAVVETVGESSPAEVSSSLHNSSSLGRKQSKRGQAEIFSHESRLRRDSAAFSSTSYGSFTTYEKVSGKKGCGDEDAMTPIRRSSRIRNKVTSS